MDAVVELILAKAERIGVIALLLGVLYACYRIIEASYQGVWVWGPVAQKQMADMQARLAASEAENAQLRRELVECRKTIERLYSLSVKGNFTLEKSVQLAENLKDEMLKTSTAPPREGQ